jgi:hypothetical protein
MPKTNFLIVMGLYGPGNQYRAITEAIYWARHLNRRLVEPIIFHHHSTQTGPQRGYSLFSELFRLEGPRMAPLKRIQGIPKPGFIYATNDSKYVRFYSRESERYYQFPVRDLPIKRINLDKMERDRHQVIVVVLYKHRFQELPERFLGRVRRKWDFAPNVKQWADLFIRQTFSGRPFISVNLRRVCDNEKGKSFAEFFGFEVSELIDQVLSVSRLTGVDQLFLSVKPSILAMPGSRELLDWFVVLPFGFYDDLLAHHYSVIEQAISLRSAVYLYSSKSSFSNFVAVRRPELPNIPLVTLISGFRQGS